MIAEACANMNVQLLITLGSEAANLDSLSKFSENTIVVDYAPQLELLQLASLTVTHAGLNTTLESLSNGVPIVAIPIANDQPGVGARIAWTGTGEVVPLDNISVEKLRTVIRKVLTDDSYKQKAIYFQRVMEESSGTNKAANIIEQILLS